MTGRLVVLASGHGSSLQALIDATAQGRLDAEIRAVFVNRRGAMARERADSAGIPQDFLPLRPYLDRHTDPGEARQAYDADLAARVSVHDPDAIVLAGWMHLFTSAFLDRFPGRVVNLHPALPGAFPGAHAIDDAWAAYERGEIETTGVMVHLVPDEGVDDGPVLATREIPILADDDRDALETRIHAVEHELLVAAVGEFVVSP